MNLLSKFSCLTFIVLSFTCFQLQPTNAMDTRGDQPLQDFLSQANTPFREKWQRPEPTTLRNKISDDPSYLSMIAYLRAKENNNGSRGTFDYWDQFDENYHGWDFCPYGGTRIGEYLEPDEVVDNCCVCNDGWQCQFESRNFDISNDEYRQCLSPDLALQNFVTTVTEITPGDYSAGFSLNTKNIGSGGGQDFEVVVYQDDVELGRRNFGGLDVQESTTITEEDFSETTTGINVNAGDYIFRAEATLLTNIEGNTNTGNTSSVFEETDLTNNVAEQTLTVQSPDLTVTDLMIAPQNEVIGQTQKHTITVTTQNLGSKLAQTTEIKLVLVVADGTETQIITEIHDLFPDDTQTETFTDIEVFLPFGSYLIRAEITPQQYDNDVSNNLYEETVTATMPTFVPITIESINNFIYESPPRQLTDNETIFISNGVTDTILVQAKTSLLADVTVEWNAVDSQLNEQQPTTLNNYDTSSGHGGAFRFDTPETYTIQATFADPNNDNNTATFDVVTVVVQIQPPTPIALSSEQFLIFENGVRTIADGETINLTNSVTQQIRISAKPNIGTDANVTWNIIDDQGTLIDKSLHYFGRRDYSAQGHSCKFNLTTAGTYTIQAVFTDINNPTTNTATFDLITFTVADPLPPARVQAAYILNSDLSQASFYDTRTLLIPPNTSSKDLLFEIEHPYGNSGTINVTMGDYVKVNQTTINNGHSIALMNFNTMAAETLTLVGTINDGAGNTITLPDFVFDVVIDNSLSQTSFQAFYDGDKFNGTAFNHNDSFPQKIGANTKTSFCLKTSRGTNVTVTSTLTDNQPTPQTYATSSTDSYDYQFGHCVEYTNLPVGNFTLTMLATDIADPTNTYTTNPFNFTLTAEQPLGPLTVRVDKNGMYQLYSNNNHPAVSTSDTVRFFVKSPKQGYVDMDWEILDAQNNPLTNYTVSNYSMYGYSINIQFDTPGTYTLRGKAIDQNDNSLLIWSDPFIVTVQ